MMSDSRVDDFVRLKKENNSSKRDQRTETIHILMQKAINEISAREKNIYSEGKKVENDLMLATARALVKGYILLVFFFSFNIRQKQSTNILMHLPNFKLLGGNQLNFLMCVVMLLNNTKLR